MLDWLSENSWAATWLSATGAFGTMATAIIALQKYFGERRKEKVEQQRRFSYQTYKLGAQFESLQGNVLGTSQNSNPNAKNFIENLDEVFEEIAVISEIPDSMKATRKLILAQLDWVKGEYCSWVKKLDDEPEEAEKEWVGGTINGVLDAVKDGILTYSDYEYLQKDFWTELATPYIDDGFDVKEIPLEPSDDDFKKAHGRWVKESQRENVRIKALVDYKVIAEHALILCLRGEFSNKKLNELPRSGKFELSVVHVQHSLLKKLQNQIVDHLQ